jgi:Holliday junction resolvase RusA-like endonuclease
MRGIARLCGHPRYATPLALIKRAHSSKVSIGVELRLSIIWLSTAKSRRTRVILIRRAAIIDTHTRQRIVRCVR